jgi:hypothetical protein
MKVLTWLFCLFFGMYSLMGMAQTTLVSNQAGLAQKKSQYRKALGQADGFVFTSYSSNADLGLGFVIEKYSSDMIFLSDRKIEAIGKQRILKLVQGDSFFYWVSVLKVKRQVFKLFYHRLGLSLEGSVESRELATVTGLEMDISQWETTTALDRKSLGIFGFGIKSGWVEDGKRLTMARGYSIDQHGRPLDSFEIALPEDFGVDEVVWRSAEVNAFGDMGMVYEDLNANGTLFSGKKEVSHFHVIYRLNRRSYQERISTLGMVRELAIVQKPLCREFEVYGFWSEWKQTGISGHVKGTFSQSSTKDPTASHWETEAFTWDDWQYRQMSGLLATKKLGKPESFFIRDVVGLSHGGCVVLAEQFFETRQMETYYVNGVPQTSSKLFYHYGDIAAMFLGATGQLDTLIMIHKTQVGTASNAYLYGFTNYICAGSLNLVYNDDEGEMNRVMHVEIDNTFAMEKAWLFRSDNIPGAVVPFEGLHTDYCTLTIPIYRDKQWHWLQVYSND